MVSLGDFRKMELVIAQIKEANDHPDADRLYVLKVDLGSETLQLVAGIKKCYTKEQFIGRRVVIIKNLEPAVIRGVESQGMLLAASDEQGPAILTPDREVPLGVTVK